MVRVKLLPYILRLILRRRLRGYHSQSFSILGSRLLRRILKEGMSYPSEH